MYTKKRESYNQLACRKVLSLCYTTSFTTQIRCGRVIHLYLSYLFITCGECNFHFFLNKEEIHLQYNTWWCSVFLFDLNATSLSNLVEFMIFQCGLVEKSHIKNITLWLQTTIMVTNGIRNKLLSSLVFWSNLFQEKTLNTYFLHFLLHYKSFSLFLMKQCFGNGHSFNGKYNLI